MLVTVGTWGEEGGRGTEGAAALGADSCSSALARRGRGQRPALPTHVPNRPQVPVGMSPDAPHLAPPVGPPSETDDEKCVQFTEAAADPVLA